MPIDTRVFVSGQTVQAAQLTQRARKRTKIVATIGPASTSEEVVRGMFQAGMNVARLNMSHGDHADHLHRLQLFRRLSMELERPVAA